MTEFTLVNHDNERTYIEESRSDAETRKQNGVNEFGFSEEDLDIVKGAFAEYDDVDSFNPGAEVNTTDTSKPQPPETDGGKTEVVGARAEPEVVDTGKSDLPDRDVSDDPFEWLPGHFVDKIEGKPAINRKGYAVLSEFYDISVTSNVVVGPEETDFTYCRCEATAVDADGREYRANGSAHVERGDDMELLLEMADTRATKRVLAIATGVGAVSVSELKNEL